VPLAVENAEFELFDPLVLVKLEQLVLNLGVFDFSQFLLLRLHEGGSISAVRENACGYLTLTLGLMVAMTSLHVGFDLIMLETITLASGKTVLRSHPSLVRKIALYRYSSTSVGALVGARSLFTEMAIGPNFSSIPT